MKVLRRILNTSVFRLSLVYGFLFSLIAATALISVYKVAESQIKLQVDTRLRLETNILLKNYQNQAVEGLIEKIELYNKKDGRRAYIYTLIHRRNLDITRSIPMDQILKNSNQIFADMQLGDIVDYVPDQKKDDKVRLLLTILPGGYQLFVASESKETQHLLSQLFQATLLAISVIFGLSILIGSFMARNMVRRINVVTKTADNIIDGDLSHRIPVEDKRNNELDRLSRSLNRMLNRNEELMQSMQAVTNNLAHDLRNPLNRIRNRLESASFKPATDENYTQITEDTIHDIDGVISTFNALLSIAQIESGAPRKNWDSFSLNSLLDDLSEIYEMVAEDKQIAWEYASTDNLQLNGNKQLVAQLLTNLLDNAFKYTPKNGKVTLNASPDKDYPAQLKIIITDTGHGIPEEENKNVFKRFHRLDKARSTEGNGLGLSLVKAVADLHHAKIVLDDNKPGLIVKVIFEQEVS